MRKFLTFWVSKVFLLNIIIAIIVVVGLTKLCLLFLANYSHHGEKIAVPNLTNLSVAEAQKKLGIIDLKLRVVDSSFHRSIKPGYIIKHQPLPSSYVKRNRTVWLTVATKHPEKVSLSSTKNMSLRQAINMFNNLGLEINELRYKSSHFSNLVLGFELNGKALTVNDKIPKHTKIDLIVGKKWGYHSTAPNLMNKILNDAIFQLHNAGLNIGELHYSRVVGTYADSINSIVYKQSIEPGKKVIPGKKINIYLHPNK